MVGVGEGVGVVSLIGLMMRGGRRGGFGGL